GTAYRHVSWPAAPTVASRRHARRSMLGLMHVPVEFSRAEHSRAKKQRLPITSRVLAVQRAASGGRRCCKLGERFPLRPSSRYGESARHGTFRDNGTALREVPAALPGRILPRRFSEIEASQGASSDRSGDGAWTAG